ncbi:MAG: AraC family transcriptional regulator [Lachnospiraceae bacterium]|nr:AraC family transcriptional regulator [Lachnospiraceae bacterium]
MLKKEYIYKEFLRKENNILRAPYNPELEFYSAIKSGDINKVKEICVENFTSKKGLGTLSSNSIQNIKYHFAITAALIARYCIEGGMDVSTSYSLSDFYIQKADIATNFKDIDHLHKKLCLDYTTRMHNLRKHKICSIHIVRCIDYIQDNLHTRITLDELSDLVGLSPAYLSRLFKKETGTSTRDYIRQLKLDAAKNMLVYSDFTPAQIASILAFPDQSYFTEVFHKYMGITPKKYQSQHLRELALKEK